MIFARISLTAASAFVASQVVQGLIALNVETYAPMRWHATCIYWAILLIAFLVNVPGIRLLPHIETTAFLFHVSCLFVLLIPLVYLSPQSSVNFVFSDIENTGGWRSDGVSFGIGLMTSAWCFVGKHSVKLWCKCYMSDNFGGQGSTEQAI